VRRSLLLLVPLFVAFQARADAPGNATPIVRALRDEMARSIEGLSLPGAKKPYYLAYRVDDGTDARVGASFGALTEDHVMRQQVLHTDVRVGDYGADSGNFIAGDSPWSWSSFRFSSIPLEDTYDAVRRAAWLSADDRYKSALDSLEKKVAVRASQEASPDQVDDFSHEPVVQYVDQSPIAALDPTRYRALVKALSAVGGEYPDVQTSTANLGADAQRRSFVSSEGSVAVEVRSAIHVDLVLRAQADDGMKLVDYLSFAACSASRLPSQDELVAAARRIATELEEARRAPVVEDYTGPVLFEGRAAPQVVRQILSGDLSGTPPPESGNARGMEGRQSELVGQIGHRILPVGYRLEDDPLADQVGALPLAGCYKIDDEGVPAQKVTVVDDGLFRAFLMSRTPRKGFPRSDGHARDDFRASPRGHLGNLILTAKGGLSDKELRKRLIAEAKAANLPYALVIRVLDDSVTRMDGSFEWPRGGGDRGPAVLVMSKVSLDGKEERVRGGHLGEMPLRILKEVVAAGAVPFVRSEAGFGGVGDSVASPALLFKELQINKSREPSKKVPLAPRPDLGPSTNR
jgi:TldD protein